MPDKPTLLLVSPLGRTSTRLRCPDPPPHHLHHRWSQSRRWRTSSPWLCAAAARPPPHAVPSPEPSDPAGHMQTVRRLDVISGLDEGKQHSWSHNTSTAATTENCSSLTEFTWPVWALTVRAEDMPTLRPDWDVSPLKLLIHWHCIILWITALLHLYMKLLIPECRWPWHGLYCNYRNTAASVQVISTLPSSSLMKEAKNTGTVRHFHCKCAKNGRNVKLVML